jgi:hypothetical protein
MVMNLHNWFNRTIQLTVVIGALSSGFFACSKPHRVGEHVWVEWDGKRYRAFVVERAGSARLRIQFEGCDSHWQREVAQDKIVARLDEAEANRPPSSVACGPTGPTSKGDAGVVATPYKVSDRVRVRWRGSVYTATVVTVVAPDKFLVHYDGHENAWDEVVPIERMEGPR